MLHDHEPGATLVLVDDDSEDALMLRTAAERGEIDVRIVHLERGQSFLDAIDQGGLPPRCLVLLDLNMPTMDGFTVLSRLRDMPTGWSVPVVVYSTSSDQLQVDRAYAEGANAYLTKPRSLMQTIDVMGVLIRHWFAHGQLPVWRRDAR